MSETSKIHKSKLIRNFIISLSISFLILSGIVTIKTLKIPLNNTYYKKTIPKKLDPNEQLQKSENILSQPVKVQGDSEILDEDALSKNDKETKVMDINDTTKARSENNIDTNNKLNGKLETDDPYESRLVYTIQIESRPKIEYTDLPPAN